MATYTRSLWRVREKERLFLAQLVVQTAFAKNGTNYWTVRLAIRRPARGAFAKQTAGETVGTIFSLATRKLDANTAEDLYNDPHGMPMTEGDELVATITSVGTPAVLDNPEFLLDIDKE